MQGCLSLDIDFKDEQLQRHRIRHHDRGLLSEQCECEVSVFRSHLHHRITVARLRLYTGVYLTIVPAHAVD